MKEKKELKYFGMLLAVIPTIFLILGMVNFFVIKDCSQGIGFIVSGIVIAFLSLLAFLYEKNRVKKLKKIKKENKFYMMKIDKITEEDGVLEITVSYNHENKVYLYTCGYETKSDIKNKIEEKINECHVNEVKVFVDFKKYKNFTMMFEDFLKQINVNDKVDLLYSSVLIKND